MVSLHRMLQHENNPIKSFVASIKVIAINYRDIRMIFQIKRVPEISYLNETSYHVAGLIDQNLRKKVLTQALTSTVKDPLPTLLDYVSDEALNKT